VPPRPSAGLGAAQRQRRPSIVGASRPEQVAENVKALDVQIPPEVLTRIDDVLGDVVVRDPALTTRNAPATRPA